MIGVILAAGVASRLRPLTDHSPKCLLKVGERCLLQRTVDALVANGIGELVVVTGYLHEMIEDFVAKQYANSRILIILLFIPIVVIYIHLHLTQVLMTKLIGF